VVRKLAILAFLIRGTFYAVEQPIWEGFDEWAHFGYVQHVVQYGRLPSRSDPLSDPLQRAVELAPVSAAAAETATQSLTYDAFWRLPSAERLRRERELRELRSSYKSAAPGKGALMQYEAQQPPLYYLLLAIPYLAVKGFSLPAQALTLRLASLLITAAGLLLCCRLASQVPACRRAAIPILLLLASWPGLLAGVCGIGNESLALTGGAAAILCLFRIVRRGSGMRDWILAGAALGAGLLTKSYMLALLPLLPLGAMVRALRRRSSPLRAASGCLLALALAGVTAGWCYIRTWLATGTLSGEMLDVAAGPGFAGRLATIRNINWLRVLDTAASTHIWTGGWSFLTVRSWMYRVFELLAIAAGAGLIALAARLARKARRRRSVTDGEARLSVAACAFLLFVFGMAYFAIVVYLTRGISMTAGWYLYGIAGAEAVLLASGFTGLAGTRRAAGCVAAAATLAGALDLYTVHFVSAPYYAGLTAHLPSGLLATFHLAGLRGVGLAEVFARLTVDKPAGVGPAIIAALWVGYLCATTALMGYSAVIFKDAFFPKRKFGKVASDARREVLVNEKLQEL